MHIKVLDGLQVLHFKTHKRREEGGDRWSKQNRKTSCVWLLKCCSRTHGAVRPCCSFRHNTWPFQLDETNTGAVVYTVHARLKCDLDYDQGGKSNKAPNNIMKTQFSKLKPTVF